MTTENEQTPTNVPEPVEQQPNAEAARWRRQLREAEAERDGLRSRIESLQRAEVERIAADRLSKPESLWKSEGLTLADLLGEDGNVDAEKVQAAITSAVDGLGLQEVPAHLRPETQGAYVPSEGRDPGRPGDTASWQQLLQGD